MSGLIGAMNTALSGLTAFETGIGAVSGNLANQTTPGYAVETVDLSTQAGQAGAGVQAPQITRAADGFAAGLLRTANSAAQAASTQSTALTAISNALQNNGDVQSAMDQFFLDVGTLAANPSSTAQQQTVLSDAQAVTGAYNAASGAINDVMTGATTTLQQNIASANDFLSQLQTINQALGQTPNNPSLLDQQESALQSLSSLITVNIIPQNNGQVMVSSGGNMLLDQSGAQTLNLSKGADGEKPEISVGNASTALSLGSTDGTIGANLQVWQAGSQALQSLNINAAAFTTNVNQTQANGLTTAGQSGSALFNIAAPTVTSDTANIGTAALTAQIANASQLPADGGPFLLSYSGSSGWNATDQASQQSYALGTGSNLTFAGMNISVSGTPLSGDQFVLNPAPNAASNISVVATNPNAIASADPYVVTAGAQQYDGSILDDNAGTTTVGADTVTTTPAVDATIIPASYYGQALQITFTTSTSYNVSTTANPGAGIATGGFTAGQGSIAVAYPAGAAGGQYWQVPFSGTASAGDVLTIQPGGSSSGSNAVRLAALWTTPGTTSSGSLQSSIVGLSTALGSNAQQAQQSSSETASQMTTVSNNLQTISGVSLDQQAVMLTGYSQAYQAAAQVISTAHTMFESLLQAI